MWSDWSNLSEINTGDLYPTTLISSRTIESPKDPLTGIVGNLVDISDDGKYLVTVYRTDISSSFYGLRIFSKEAAGYVAIKDISYQEFNVDFFSEFTIFTVKISGDGKSIIMRCVATGIDVASTTYGLHIALDYSQPLNPSFVVTQISIYNAFFVGLIYPYMSKDGNTIFTLEVNIATAASRSKLHFFTKSGNSLVQSETLDLYSLISPLVPTIVEVNVSSSIDISYNGSRIAFKFHDATSNKIYFFVLLRNAQTGQYEVEYFSEHPNQDRVYISADGNAIVFFNPTYAAQTPTGYPYSTYSMGGFRFARINEQTGLWEEDLRYKSVAILEPNQRSPRYGQLDQVKLNKNGNILILGSMNAYTSKGDARILKYDFVTKKYVEIGQLLNLTAPTITNFRGIALTLDGGTLASVHNLNFSKTFIYFHERQPE